MVLMSVMQPQVGLRGRNSCAHWWAEAPTAILSCRLHTFEVSYTEVMSLSYRRTAAARPRRWLNLTDDRGRSTPSSGASSVCIEPLPQLVITPPRYCLWRRAEVGPGRVGLSVINRRPVAREVRIQRELSASGMECDDRGAHAVDANGRSSPGGRARTTARFSTASTRTACFRRLRRPINAVSQVVTAPDAAGIAARRDHSHFSAAPTATTAKPAITATSTQPQNVLGPPDSAPGSQDQPHTHTHKLRQRSGDRVKRLAEVPGNSSSVPWIASRLTREPQRGLRSYGRLSDRSTFAS